MAENVVINDTTYNGVDALALLRPDGSVVTFYPDAVRYNAQNLTEAQKAQARQNIGVGSVDEVAAEVLARLGTPVFGTVDADNNIILTGNLAEGVYVLKYEDADGNVTEIGTITLAPEPTYKNWIEYATSAPGSTTIYNGKGYKENTRWSSSSAAESNATGVYVTGCIPWTKGATVYLKNIRMNKSDTASNVRHICSYSGSAWTSQDMASASDFKPVWDADGNLTQFTLPNWDNTYFRLNTGYIGLDSILTINEPIN